MDVSTALLSSPGSTPAVAEPDPAVDPIDARLVRGCLEGDDAAWEALLARYKNLIYSIPLRYGFSPQEANDIFQDVCVELIASLPRLREPRALPRWIAQVAAHRCARLKQIALGQRTQAGDLDPLERIAGDEPAIEEVLLDAERQQTLRTAVDALSPRCRQLIQRLFFETPARPYREVARELNVSCGSIGFIRGRCLACLRAELRHRGFR